MSRGVRLDGMPCDVRFRRADDELRDSLKRRAPTTPNVMRDLRAHSYEAIGSH